MPPPCEVCLVYPGHTTERWIELTEQTFHFATYARKAFDGGSLELKREIFAALGQNFLVKDKKVTISGCEWFVPIQKSYPALEADYKRLELNENGSINEKTPAFAEVISRWGAVVEEVRTVFALRNDATVYIPRLEEREMASFAS